MTQVVITESDNPSLTVNLKPTVSLTTDVVKTYFVTYTYFSTMLDGDETVVHSNIATSADIVTEKFLIPPKRTTAPAPIESSTTKTQVKSEDLKTSESVSATNSEADLPINILATKTYLTTFTYFTTLLQDNGGKIPSTIVSSRSRVVQNIVTETVDTSLFDADYLESLKKSLHSDHTPIVATATLNDGQKMEITAVEDGLIKPTSTVITSELTPTETPSIQSSSSSDNNVIKGSTIIFFDENDQIDENLSPTKSVTIESAASNTKAPNEAFIDQDDSETAETQFPDLANAESLALPLTTLPNGEVPLYVTSILKSSTVTKNGATLTPGMQVIKLTDSKGNVTVIPVSDPVKKHPQGTSDLGLADAAVVGDLLNFGSLGMNGLNALGPMINAMAGLITSNLNDNHKNSRNETIIISKLPPRPAHLSENPLLTYAGPKPPPPPSAQPLQAPGGPIYIPLGNLAADSVPEESQNIEGHNVFPDVDQRTKLQVVLGRPTMESPLLAGGIPISPGQVITTNSDVIIGKPAVHGPRPPELKSKPLKKDDTPIDMKPPPLPKPQKPKWPNLDNNPYYSTQGHIPGPVRLPPTNDHLSTSHSHRDPAPVREQPPLDPSPSPTSIVHHIPIGQHEHIQNNHAGENNFIQS
ncbi:hypothetical protein LSTR_LSTR015530 [Laodelphax striatellus]|uniref:DUF4758 domain-containing protein n=1 Tax=Laodelphax striatellus TaxID=195883 RepID=A0A482XQ08_LAOST|nr:hypothetical protein LSTR_LSTR015530 [Laodelphax striatellus]